MADTPHGPSRPARAGQRGDNSSSLLGGWKKLAFYQVTCDRAVILTGCPGQPGPSAQSYMSAPRSREGWGAFGEIVIKGWT